MDKDIENLILLEARVPGSRVALPLYPLHDSKRPVLLGDIVPRVKAQIRAIWFVASLRGSVFGLGRLDLSEGGN